MINQEKYQKKYPNSYQVLNAIRNCHYKLFKRDLSFNGDRCLKHFGCVETWIYAYFHTCRFFNQTSYPKGAFTVATEKGNINNKSDYLNFIVNNQVIENQDNDKIWEFLSLCFKEITTRNINLILTKEHEINFMYIPFDNVNNHKELCATDDKYFYSSEEFIIFLQRLFDNQHFNINFIDDEILSRLNQDELDWLKLVKVESQQKFLEDGKVPIKIDSSNILKLKK